MKNFIKNMKNGIADTSRKIAAKVKATRYALTDTTAETYVDTGVKIIIAVVIGGVVLAGLYTLFNTTIFDTLRTKITTLFSYDG